MPTVSIIIPAYNAAHFLPQALESCLNQTHADYEIIVVNDGSTDNTHEVAVSYPNVICIDQENRGLAGARNTGIAYASGDYLQFLDADDMLLPEKLARCLAMFAADPEAGLVYTDYDVRTPDMSATSPTPKPDVPLAEGYILDTLINHTSTLFRVPCPLVKSSLVRQVDGFTLGMQGVEDWNFWIKLAAIGTKFRLVPEVLVWYRHTEGSMSRNRVLMTRSRLKAMADLRRLNLPAHLNLEEKIAGRHHALAMVLWEEGQHAAAREEFQAAIQTHPKSRLTRSALRYATYVIPPKFIHRLLGWRAKK